MKVLNLVYPEKSDIKFTISRFPDGQQQVTINQTLESLLPKTLYLSNFINIQIKSRLNNFEDLELIICAVKSLRNLTLEKLKPLIHLYTPYLMGGRSDRQFEEGSNNYLKDVICPIINSLNLETVTVLDPHSDVIEACINNLKKEDNYQLMRSVLVPPIYEPNTEDTFVLISPDAGANKKIFKLAKQIGYFGDVITCSKSRNEKGELSNITVPLTQNHYKKDFIIIDDICDGGATFINIAKYIKESLYSNQKIYLVVTHGIFSKGFTELNKYFDGIYCTNSYKDYPLAYQVTSPEYDHYKLKQLNIF